MGMMMMQQRHDSEAREADLALRQEEMAIRHEESQAQQQMMNTMMMTHIQQQQRSFGNRMKSRPELGGMLPLDLLGHERIVLDGQVCGTPVNRN